MFISDKLVDFYNGMKPPVRLPKGIDILFPQQDAAVREIIHSFYSKYYNDNQARHIILGINPGRFGAGITGINFTAPKQLSAYCGIKHPFKESSELSAEFIYEVINAYGGPALFYNNFFLSAMCPLGFVRQGKNINYYDDVILLQRITPFIVSNIKMQLSLGCKTENCFCIGEDKNYKFLSFLNEKHQWFNKITPLPHPRFIMQYKRSHKEKYILQYLLAIRTT